MLELWSGSYHEIVGMLIRLETSVHCLWTSRIRTWTLLSKAKSPKHTPGPSKKWKMWMFLAPRHDEYKLAGNSYKTMDTQKDAHNVHYINKDCIRGCWNMNPMAYGWPRFLWPMVGPKQSVPNANVNAIDIGHH